jgi:phage terminase large subunit
MKENLDNAHHVKVTGVYGQLHQATKPVVVCVGGAGSSKSYSLAQLIVWKLINEKDKVLAVGRKTLPALRMTAYLLIVNLLKSYDLYQLCDHNKTEHTIDFRGNRLQFFSLDDPEKIKSFNANEIWLEEANEFTFEDYTIIKLRLNRDPGPDLNHIYLSFNPVESWIFDKLEIPDAQWIHSTYKDNPFLSEAYTQLLEGLKDQDMNYYSIYALGKRGKFENIIYPDWNQVESMPEDLERECYGIDFGYEPSPTVVVHIGLIKQDLYFDELLYQTHLTNSELIEFLKTLPCRQSFADSAEPQRIGEINNAGLPCTGAMKNVKLGIDTVKRHHLYFTKRSANGIKEIRSYQRKKDKAGRVLEDPVEFNDHFMDSIRYGVVGLVGYQPLVPKQEIVEFNTLDFVPDLDL